MKHIAVIYHSGNGNTEQLAHHVATGARDIDGTTTTVLQATDLTSQPDRLLAFDGHIFGSPTYLGGVSGPFKSFMDATGKLWRTQGLKGRLGSWTGLMAQAGHSARGTGFVPGDLRTAKAFGRNFASVLARTDIAVEEVS